MAEFIKDQPVSVSASPGDFFVFDTATQTYKITRQNLIGQMDANAVDIATNVSDIATNVSDIEALEIDLKGIKTEIIHVDSSEILDSFNNPKVLVSIGAASYIQVIDIYFEYIHVTTEYAVSGNLSVQSGGFAMGQIDGDIIKNPNNMGGRLMPIIPTSTTSAGDLTLSSLVANPTLGDGTLILSIIYKGVS